MKSKLLKYTTTLTVLLASFAAATAQTWTPTRPIRLIVPYAAGGAGDIGVRSISDKLSEAIGQPIVVDNRGGAGGAIGTEQGARAPADGYTWLLGSDVAMTILPHLRKVPYDPLTQFEPVGLIATLPMVLVVNPSLPVNSISDFVALAKKRSLTLGTNGIGTNAQLTGELLKRAAKIDLVHVPYTGQPQVITDLLGGQIDLAISSVGPVLQHIKSGRLRALALTSTRRLDSLPGIPTLAESGFPDIDVNIWLGLFAPEKTPSEIVAKVNSEMSKILSSAAVKERYGSLGYVPAGGAPSVLRKLTRDDYARWGKLIEEAGIKE